MYLLSIGPSRARGLAATLAAVASMTSLAAADIFPTARTSSTSSAYDSSTSSESSVLLTPFVSHLQFADQETSFTNTTINGAIDVSPFAIGSPMQPHHASASSSFVLHFNVETATTFVITGNISRWGILTMFQLEGPGGILYTPTYQPDGPTQIATLSYNAVLAPGAYTLTASAGGNADGAGAPYHGTINFQINAAPTPGAAAILALGGLAAVKRRR